MPSIGPLELLVLIVLLAFWIAPAALVAQHAARKGQNFWLFLLLGLLTSFIVSLIVALLIPDSSRNSPATETADLDRLAKLSEVHSAGALSDDEFATERARLLGPPARSGGETFNA